MTAKSATRPFRDLEMWSLFVRCDSQALALDIFQKCGDGAGRRLFYLGRETDGMKALRWKESDLLERFAPDTMVSKISTTVVTPIGSHPGAASPNAPPRRSSSMRLV